MSDDEVRRRRMNELHMLQRERMLEARLKVTNAVFDLITELENLHTPSGAWEGFSRRLDRIEHALKVVRGHAMNAEIEALRLARLEERL